MKKFTLVLILIACSLKALSVTFDVDGLRYNVLSMSDKTVELAILPLSTTYSTQTSYQGDIVIPSKVEYNGIEFDVVGIGDFAFSDGAKVTSVSIPNTVTYIGFAAFSSCFNIKNLDLPVNLKSVGAAAFRDSGIERIVIPNSVTNLESSLFYGCRNLVSVKLPDNLEGIKESVFQECSALQEIEIPTKVKSIGDAAFLRCGISKCKLPEGLTEIGNSCFYGSDVDSLIIPNGVKEIKNYTFYQCSWLRYVKLPEKLDMIGEQSFRGCHALLKITIPEGITTIKSYTFADCFNMEELNLPTTLKNIGNDAFLHCQKISKLVVPEGVEIIYSEAFYGASIKELTLPSTLSKIGDWAFGIAEMDELVLPASLTSIGTKAFADNAIKRVVCMSETPLECSENIFHNDTYLNGKLAVPLNTKEKYERIKPWSDFFFIEEDPTLAVEAALENGNFQVTGETIRIDGKKHVEVFDMGGNSIFEGNTELLTLSPNKCYLVKLEGKIYKIAM